MAAACILIVVSPCCRADMAQATIITRTYVLVKNRKNGHSLFISGGGRGSGVERSGAHVLTYRPFALIITPNPKHFGNVIRNNAMQPPEDSLMAPARLS